MRTSIDILRSLKRYIAIALGPEWEVRLLSEEGTFGRPAAQIMEATGQTITGPSHASDLVQTFMVHVFPVPGDTVMESLLAASEAEEKLFQAFRWGIDKGRTARLPLYDYAATPLDEGSSTRRTADYARILDLELSRTQSPSDELLFTVSAEVRLGWRRGGRLPSGKVAQRVNINEIVT